MLVIINLKFFPKQPAIMLQDASSGKFYLKYSQNRKKNGMFRMTIEYPNHL